MRRRVTLAGLSLALLLCVGQVSARENTSSTEAAPAPSSFRGVATVTGVADGDTLYADIEGHSIVIVRPLPFLCPLRLVGTIV